MFNKKMRLIVIFILIIFSWSTLTAEISFTEKDNDVLLKKAEELFKKEQYRKAVDVLVFFIKENGNNWSKEHEMAIAYYILANIYFKNDKTDKKIKVLINNVIRLNTDYIANGPDTEFIKFFFKIKQDIKTETYTKKIEIEKREETKRKEEAKRVIEKEGKKKKKKFPLLLVAGGVVVIAIAIYLLTRKYDSGSTVLANEVYNSIEWMNVPEGEFIMGDESTFSKIHTVFLDTYNIAKNEITFDQYDKFCEDTRRDKPGDSNFGRGNRPVINVTWHDAEAFCEWLSKKTGKTVKLPTEAQWEKAARGTDQRIYPWGNNWIANWGNYNPSNVGVGTMPVGSFPDGASPYGLNDMAGNVSEWCSDWYGDNYFEISPRENPQGPKSGKAKIEKGGSWRLLPKFLMIASRRMLRPKENYYYLGFRVAKE